MRLELEATDDEGVKCRVVVRQIEAVVHEYDDMPQFRDILVVEEVTYDE